MIAAVGPVQLLQRCRIDKGFNSSCCSAAVSVTLQQAGGAVWQ